MTKLIVFQDKLGQATIFMNFLINCGFCGKRRILFLALYLKMFVLADFYEYAKVPACIKKCAIHLKFAAKLPD